MTGISLKRIINYLNVEEINQEETIKLDYPAKDENNTEPVIILNKVEY